LSEDVQLYKFVLGDGPRRGVSKSASKVASRDTSRPPSAIENHIDYFREPVVKSPPEPTRVKSPEQLLIRSPDPINWTVPLDTGKTFSVTQSVRDNDSARNSPMSDHSSHFDSVSGTAINLGVHSINDKGSLLYPKVSALAREAKELQGKTTPSKDDINNEVKSGLKEPASINGEAAPSNGQKSNLNGDSAPPAAQKSNLRCLEDPNFSFDDPAKGSSNTPSSAKLTQPEVSNSSNPAASASPSHIPLPTKAGSSAVTGPSPAAASISPAVPQTTTPSSIPVPVTSAPKKPSYRVLEDPDLDSPKPMSTPYKVLEDPSMMMASIYQPSDKSGSGKI